MTCLADGLKRTGREGVGGERNSYLLFLFSVRVRRTIILLQKQFEFDRSGERSPE